jgi:hypothetical protein
MCEVALPRIADFLASAIGAIQNRRMGGTLDAVGRRMLGFLPHLGPHLKNHEEDMAKRKDFNLSEAIRTHRATAPKATAKEAFESISKNAGHKINEGTFKSTFYKLAGAKKRTVRRLKPAGRRGPGDGAGIVGQALAFIRSAGGIEQAKEILSELESIRKL